MEFFRIQWPQGKVLNARHSEAHKVLILAKRYRAMTNGNTLYSFSIPISMLFGGVKKYIININS